MDTKDQTYAPKKSVRISFLLLVSFLASSLSLIGCITQPTAMPTLPLTPPPSPTPVVNTVAGNLLNQVYQLEDFMPLADSDGFVIPKQADQAAFSKIVSSLEAGDLVDSKELAKENDYILVRYIDLSDEKQASYLLREELPISRGWGLYAFREEAANNIIVEAPHPLSDKKSDLIALDIYRALNARALLIAGTHRYANQDDMADVSHAPDSIFQSIHETLVQETPIFSDVPVVLQIHGFAANKHPGYPNVVLGFGQKTSQTEILLSTRLVGALAAQGIEAGLCRGNAWKDLCGTKNVQGTGKLNAVFIHIELDETVRDDHGLLIAALTQVFTK